MDEEKNFTSRANSYIKNTVTLKVTSITILILLLLIPTSMITSIIEERERMNNDAINEVSAKWANSQSINGPILTIPLLYEQINNEKVSEIVRYYHMLPESLDIDGDIIPEKLKRGIYEVVVYKSTLNIAGNFKLNPKIDRANLKAIQLDRAFLTIGISDLRGIEDDIIFNWGNEKIKAQPGSKIPSIIGAGVTIDLPDLNKLEEKSIDFNFKLELQGSQNIAFVPIGRTTSVNLNSAWTSPSFNGNFLPRNREVTDNGFNAQWKVLQLNRNFPQNWTGNGYAASMQESEFGLDLLLPLDDYQKSMRSAKYAIMTIALTFLIFFLVEVLNGRKIHPFQYILVGLSLCLFYVLLVSISEHTSFNLAYGISTVGIVSMVSLYAMSIFKSGKLTTLLISTLTCIYGFLFVTLQLADYALLMGSIGLALILGATMYFTRNVDWYNLTKED